MVTRKRKNPLKSALRVLLALAVGGAGVAHFVSPAFFVSIMPDALPWHLELVYLSGVFELLGAIGLLIPRTRRAAAWGVLALFIAVYPANIHHALHPETSATPDASPWVLWTRVGFQFVLFAWAWWMTRPDEPKEA